MKYIRHFEGFKDWFKKPKNKNWGERINDIYNFYLKNKDTDKSKKDFNLLDLPNIIINDNSVSFSVRLNQISLYGDTGGIRNFEVVDFSEADIYDFKSDRGVYKIDKTTYEKYRKKAEEIQDWLDDLDERGFNKSDIKIGEGDFKFDEVEMALEELNYKIKDNLPIGKKLEFEIRYYNWLSLNSNEKVIERVDFKIKDVIIDFSGGRFYVKVFVDDPFGQNSSIWVESDSNYEYHDLEVEVERELFLNMSSEYTEMTSKQKRDFDKNRKYPYAFSYDVSPSKYDSIEFIKTITEILSELNNNIKL